MEDYKVGFNLIPCQGLELQLTTNLMNSSDWNKKRGTITRWQGAYLSVDDLKSFSRGILVDFGQKISFFWSLPRYLYA